MIRNKAFWILDKLKGREVRGHYQNIKSSLEQFSSRESQVNRDRNLKNLLDHAVTNTGFYATYKEYSSILDFPVIDKIDIRNKCGHFQAKKGVSGNLTTMYTSGSTGTPFQIKQDHRKRIRNTADALYFGEMGGYTLGQPLYYIKKWDSVNKKNRFTKWSQNIVPVNVEGLTEESLEKILEGISNQSSEISLIGYSSGLNELCNYIKEKRIELRVNVSGIIAIAEALGPKTRKDLQSIFNTTVVSRYSNVENGILAQEFKGSDHSFHINWASYHMEILELDSNQPAKHGQLGRIVITDLFNYAMPMIRYDTGDLGMMEANDKSFNAAPKLTKVEGRKMDIIYDTDGNSITPFFAYDLECFSELRQFQVIQEEKKKYTVLLNTDAKFAGEQKAMDILKEHLGKNAEIHFKYVDEIPLLASGKRKLTLNLLQTND